MTGDTYAPPIRKSTVGFCSTCHGPAEQPGVVKFMDLQCWVCRRLKNSVAADHARTDTLKEYEEV
jgi:hypothetical protein